MAAPRRVVFLATDFRPMTGGIAELLHGLADPLARQLPVIVMTSVPQNGTRWNHAYDLEPLPPVPERELGRRSGDWMAPLRKFHTGVYFHELRRYARDTIRALGAQSPGAAVVVGSWDTPSHFWCKACRRARLPYYLLAHGRELLLPLYGRLPAWRREDFACAEAVLANSRATADLAVRRLGISRPPVVMNAVVGPRPAPGSIAGHASQLRGQLGIAAGPVLLTVGRLVARKGCDLVVRSVAELKEEYPNLTYVIAGDGPERDALQALVRSLHLEARVRMLGQVDETTKWALYDVCDLFVMPNRLLGGTEWEGFGLVFVEAALCGRPSIGGRNAGVPDAVEDGVTGVLVDPEERGALTAAIRRLAGDAAGLARMGREAEERARAQFSGEAITGRLRAQLGWK